MMTLRARLVLWLLVMSVVPLGAVTVYSYINSARALRQAAGREADLLAGELTSRMQLVTAELSTRVEKLMAMQEQPVRQLPAKAPPKAKPAVTAPASIVPVTPPAATPETTVSLADVDAAKTLGDAAILLNSVELQGMGSIFRSGRAGGASPGANSADRTRRGGYRPSTSASAQPSATPATETQPADAAARGAHPRPPRTIVPPVPGMPPVVAGLPQAVPSVTAPGPPGVAAPGTSTTLSISAGAQAAGASGDRVVIDVGAIAREMTKRLAPDGLDKLTPEERQRVNREIGLRIMGITEGLRMGAGELQRRAKEAKDKAAEDMKAAEATHTDVPTAGTKAAPPAPEAPAQQTETKSTLRGNKLGVTVARGGKVVHSANAEVNLDNLLMTVFSTTRRDQGEVPFAVAKDGKIYTQNVADKHTVESLGDVATPTAKLGTSQVGDFIVVTNADPSGSGLRFGIARPVGDSLTALRKTAGRNAGLGLLFIGFALVIVIPVSQTLTRNLSNLTDGVDRIAQGDFGARVPVQGSKDVAALAVAFNRMAEDIQKQQEQLVGQERLKRELELGRQIQSEMLPHESLRFGLTEVKGMSIPAREVGGDFFNYFALDDGNVALLVGDVSGKGVGAALLMANFQATLRTRLKLGHDLAAIADAMDRDIEANSPRGLYATLFVGILDPASKRLRYVNAGHNPQFALRSGSLERLSSTGTPIGLLPGRGYKQREVQLASGDFLFFYTDGVVEAEDESGEMLGPERLEQLLLTTITNSTAGPDAVLQMVETEVRKFRGAREPFDDATSMVVRIG
jgi:serine phosphatase RsbU (regulator of sigma subunit)